MATSGIYNLDKNLITDGFLDGNGSVTVGITNQTNPTALRKIATDEPLGVDEFVVDNVEAKANAQASGITFLNGAGKVSFQASGDVFAELAVFPDPTTSSFTSALGPIADTKFNLAKDPSLSVTMLRWGADAAASGTGSIALGGAAGTLDFSAGLKGGLFFCVLQQVPRTTGTDEALAAVVSNWKMPVHVRTADDLAPRTHLLAQVGGSFTASISATFGHEFNWMRQISAGALTGDIGLKLQLGLKAAFDLTTQGNYAVVVSRETDAAVVRVRLYKLKMNSFDFALTASAAATPSVPLPQNFDDLLKATLGVHPLQILADIEDPNAIDNWINKFGPQYVGDLLKKFTGLDLAAAIAKVTSLAARWKSLPSSAQSLFVKLAEKNVPDFTNILKAAQLIANKDTAGLTTFLQTEIQNLNLPLLSSPLGQYLEGLAKSGALALLQNIPPEVQQAAQKTVDFLAGDPVETLLNGIVTDVDTRLGLDAILANLQGDPATSMDKLLFSKLTAFLDKTPAVQDIQKLQNIIKTFQGKAGDLYAKAVKALNTTYTAQLSATYQQTTTDTALVDASFDFGVPANVPAVTAALQQLLAGSLPDFLVTPQPGVTLANGTLTHQIKRNSEVDLTLPFLTTEQDWVSTSTTSFNAIDENGGRLTTYQLTQQGSQVTKNTITSLWTGRNWRSTSIALSSQISALLPSGGALRIHADSDGDKQRLGATTAAIRLEVAKMSLSQLDAGVEPFAVQFLQRAFPDNQTFETWAATGKLLAAPGNTLVSLDIALPPAVPLAWLSNTIVNKKDPIYLKMSLTLQFLLKRYLRDYYFRDIARYQNTVTAYLVLLYAAIPPAAAITVNGLPSSVSDGIFWDTQDINSATQMVELARDSATSQGFQAQLEQAHSRLMAAGEPGLAKFFDSSQGVTGFFQAALSGNNMSLLQNSLLAVESQVISDARAAALDAASFNSLAAANQPVKALRSLADFGNNIAKAFDKDLSSLFVNDIDALQRLGPLIFAQASAVFDPTVPTTNYDSTLNVTVLKPGAAMPSNFPDFTAAPADILVSLNAASFGI